MSCGGNTFRCAIGRFNKFNVADKPSNKQLHSENENNLSALLRLREEQDKGIFNSPINNISTNYKLELETNKVETDSNSSTIYTPFRYKY
jgi:hypothetical protein